MTDIYSLFPIEVNDKTLSIISTNDIKRYSLNLKEDYFNEYLDFKFNEISLQQITDTITNLVRRYKRKDTTCKEIRLVLKTKLGILCGGCTIFIYSDIIEIAYFILPKFQGSGLGYEMVKCLVNQLMCLSKPLEIRVQSINKASISLAKRLGFIEYRREQGKYVENIVYILNNIETGRHLV